MDRIPLGAALRKTTTMVCSLVVNFQTLTVLLKVHFW